jgi:hypothetical protein
MRTPFQYELPTSASRSLSGRTAATGSERVRRSCPCCGRRRQAATGTVRGVDAGCHLESSAPAPVGGPAHSRVQAGHTGGPSVTACAPDSRFDWARIGRAVNVLIRSLIRAVRPGGGVRPAGPARVVRGDPTFGLGGTRRVHRPSQGSCPTGREIDDRVVLNSRR